MPTGQTLGVPILRGTTLEDLRREVQDWLIQLANHADTMAGARGTPRFQAAPDLNGLPLQNVRDAIRQQEATTKAQSFTLAMNAATRRRAFDARGFGIVNLPPGDGPTDAVNVSQLRTILLEALLTFLNQPFVVAVASAELTADRALTPEATVTTVTDGGPNSTIIVGVATNGISNAKLRQGVGVSVIGRSANTTGDVADLAAATNGQILRRAANVLGFGAIDLADGTNAVSGVLDEPNGGTGQSVYVIGDLLTASGTTALARLADVAVGSYLRSGGVGVTPLWSTLILPNAATAGDLLVATATNLVSVLSDVAVGSVLFSGGLGATPVWAVPKQVVVLTDAATVTPAVGVDGRPYLGTLASLSQATLFANPTGTPVDGQQLMLRIISTVARALTWGTKYKASAGLPLPTTTSGGSLRDFFGFQYTSSTDTFDLLASTTGVG